MSKINNIITNVIIVLFIVFGAIGMKLIHDSYTSVIDVPIENEIYLKNLNIYIQNADVNLYTAIDKALDGEDFSEYLAMAGDDVTKGVELMTMYRDNEKSSYETAQYRRFRAGMLDYKAAIENIVKSLKEGRPDIAKNVYNQEFTPIKGVINELAEALIDLSEKYEEFKYEEAKQSAKTLGVVFVVFGLAILAVFNFINLKQMKTNAKLEAAMNKNLKAKESLNTAVFNDILTDVNNRISFVNSFAKYKIKDEKNTDYYFVMFNIDNFSSINVDYGIEAGDTILVSTASRLKSCFKNGDIYRTGSDEFVVAMKYDANDNGSGYNDVMNLVNSAFMKLSQPHDITSENLSLSYSVSVVKKNGASNVDISVLQYLKDAITKDRMTLMQKIVFFDIDAANMQ